MQQHSLTEIDSFCFRKTATLQQFISNEMPQFTEKDLLISAVPYLLDSILEIWKCFRIVVASIFAKFRVCCCSGGKHVSIYFPRRVYEH